MAFTHRKNHYNTPTTKKPFHSQSVEGFFMMKT